MIVNKEFKKYLSSGERAGARQTSQRFQTLKNATSDHIERPSKNLAPHTSALAIRSRFRGAFGALTYFRYTAQRVLEVREYARARASTMGIYQFFLRLIHVLKRRYRVRKQNLKLHEELERRIAGKK
jgi:hypothetical protein